MYIYLYIHICMLTPGAAPTGTSIWVLRFIAKILHNARCRNLWALCATGIVRSYKIVGVHRSIGKALSSLGQDLGAGWIVDGYSLETEK